MNIKETVKKGLPQVSLFILLLSTQLHAIPGEQNPIEKIDIESVTDSIASHLSFQGEDPETFIAYQTEDNGIYTYSDNLFCVYSALDSFNIHDSVTLGLASRVRNLLSIPQGHLQCMAIR